MVPDFTQPVPFGGNKKLHFRSGSSIFLLLKLIVNVHVIFCENCFDILFNFLKNFENRSRNEVTNRFLSK